METFDFDLNFVFNFVKADTPVNPGNVTGATGDFSLFIILTLFCIFATAAVFVLAKLKKQPLETAGRNPLFIRSSNGKTITTIFAILAATSLVAAISFAAPKALANTKASGDAQTINVTIDEATGNMTFDAYTFTNEKTESLAIASAQVALAEEFAKLPEFENSNFKVSGMEGILFDNNPDAEVHAVTDTNLKALDPGKSSALNFSWTGLSKESANQLLGTNALTITLKGTASLLGFPQMTKTYNGQIQDISEYVANGFIFTSGTLEAKDAGTYDVVATALPGFKWSDDPSSRDHNGQWTINQYVVSTTTTDAQINFGAISGHTTDTHKAVYDQAEHTIEITLTSTFGDTGITAEYTATKNSNADKLQDAGIYTVKASNLVGNRAFNYQLSTDDISDKYEILRAQNPIEAPESQNYESIYNDEESARTKTLPDPTSAIGQLDYSLIDAPNYFSVIGKMLSAESLTPVNYDLTHTKIVPYNFSVKITAAGNANYESGTVNFDVAWQINKAQSHPIAPTTGLDNTTTYNKTEAVDYYMNQPSEFHGSLSYEITSQTSNYFSAEAGQDKIKVTAVAATPVAWEDLPTRHIVAHQIVMVATDSGDDNYEGGSTQPFTLNWTINQAESPMKAPATQNYDIDYNSTSQAYNGVSDAIGLVNYSTTSTYSWLTSIENLTLQFDFTNPPEHKLYTVTINAQDQGNDNYKPGNVSFDINLNLQQLANRISIVETQNIESHQSTEVVLKEFEGAQNFDGEFLGYEIISVSPEVNTFTIPNKLENIIEQAKNTFPDVYTIVVRASASGDAVYAPGFAQTTITYTVQTGIDPKLVFIPGTPDAHMWNPNSNLSFEFNQAESEAGSKGKISYKLFEAKEGFSVDSQNHAVIVDKVIKPGTYVVKVCASIEASGEYYEDTTDPVEISLTINKNTNGAITFNEQTLEEFSFIRLTGYSATQQFSSATADAGPDETVTFTYAQSTESTWPAFASLISGERKINFTYSKDVDPYYNSAQPIPLKVVASASSDYYDYTNKTASADVKVKFHDEDCAKAVITTEANGSQTMTFYYDKNVYYGNNQTEFLITENVSFDITKYKKEGIIPAWCDYTTGTATTSPFAGVIWPSPKAGVSPSKVVFGESFKNCEYLDYADKEGQHHIKFTSMAFWFCDMDSVTSYEGLDNIKNQITNCEAIFANFKNVSDSSISETELDLSDFKQEALGNVEEMFLQCLFDSVTIPGGFAPLATHYNKTLSPDETIYNVSTFSRMKSNSVIFNNTFGSNVENMNYMFMDSNNIESLDMSKMDTQKVTQMDFSFANMTNVKNINLSQNNLSLVSSYNNSFLSDSKLEEIDVSSLNKPTSNPKNMFKNCVALKTIYSDKDWGPISNFDADEDPMFDGCTSLLGGNGYKYDRGNIGFYAAKIDYGVIAQQPAHIGYFTYKSPDGVTDDSVHLTYDVTGAKAESQTLYGNFTQTVKMGTSFTVQGQYSLIDPQADPSQVYDPSDICIGWTDKATGKFYEKGSTIPTPEDGSDVELLVAWTAHGKAVLYQNAAGEDDHLDFVYDSKVYEKVENATAGVKEVYPIVYTSWNYASQKPNTCPAWGKIENDEYISLIHPTVINFKLSFTGFSKYDISTVEEYGTQFTSMDAWFCNFNSIKEINGLENISNTLTSMNATFMKANYSLAGKMLAFDLTKLKQSNLSSAYDMFNSFECKNLTIPEGFLPKADKLGLSISTKNNDTRSGTSVFINCMADSIVLNGDIGTPNKTDMPYLFKNCTAKSINLNKVTTKCVVDMQEMFNGCSKLTDVNLDKFNTEAAKKMANMFQGCEALKAIRVMNDWDTTKVFETGGDKGTNMFQDCYYLEGENGSSILNAQIRDSRLTDEQILNATMARIDTWTEDQNTGNVGYFSLPLGEAWWGIHSVDNKTVLYLSPEKVDGKAETEDDEILNTSRPWRDMSYLIEKIEILPGESSMLNMRSCFNLFDRMIICTEISGLDNLNIQKVKNFYCMFGDFARHIKLSETDVNVNLNNLVSTNENVDLSNMFENAHINEFNLSNFKVKPTTMYHMFAGAIPNNNSSWIDLNSLDTSNCWDMESMFYESKFEAIDISSFSVNSYLDFENMFSNCTNLTTIIATESFDLSSRGSVNMFDNCNKLIGGNNTAYSEQEEGVRDTNIFAKLDEGSTFPGYFSDGTPHAYWGIHDVGGVTTLYLSAIFVEGKADKQNDEILNTDRPWSDQADNIEKVEILGSQLLKLKMNSCENLFADMKYCVQLEGLEYLDTSLTTSMKKMFYNLCDNPISAADVDLSKLSSTYYLTSTQQMFDGCQIKNVDLSNLVTEQVSDMGSMFSNSKFLETKNLYLDNFNTSSCESMECMFNNTNFVLIDISSFSKEKLQNIKDMFSYSEQLETVYVSKEFDLSDIGTNVVVFDMCPNIVGGDDTVWASNHSNNDYAKIDEGPSSPGYFTEKSNHAYWGLQTDENDQTSLYLSIRERLLTPTPDDCILDGYSTTSNLPWAGSLSSIDRVEVIGNPLFFSSTKNLFAGLTKCSSITGLDKCNLHNCTDCSYMFSELGKGLDSSVNINTNDIKTTENLTNTSYMFSDSNIEEISLNNINTINVETMDHMFSSCLCKTMSCTDSFSSAKITNTDQIDAMFLGCNNLESISSSINFDLSSLGTPSLNMFEGCTKLKGYKGTEYSKVTNPGSSIYAKLDGGEDSPGYFSPMKKGLAVQYATLTESGLVDTTFKFVYDYPENYKVNTPTIIGQEDIRAVFNVTYTNFDVNIFPAWLDTFGMWYVQPQQIVFDESFKDFKYYNYDDPTVSKRGAKFTSMSAWFMNTYCIDLPVFSGFENIANTIEDLSSTFWIVSMTNDKINVGKVLDLTKFDQPNIRILVGTFFACSYDKIVLPDKFLPNLTLLNNVDAFVGCVANEIVVTGTIGNVDSPNGVDASKLFSGAQCTKITFMEKFNTSNYINMKMMFVSCLYLTELDLSSFNTFNVKGMTEMFAGCMSLQKIIVGDGWDLKKVMDINQGGDGGKNMFRGCLYLTGENLTTIDNASQEPRSLYLTQDPDESHIDGYMAHVDKWDNTAVTHKEGDPGYLTSSTNRNTNTKIKTDAQQAPKKLEKDKTLVPNLESDIKFDGPLLIISNWVVNLFRF